jgi:lysozyme
MTGAKPPAAAPVPAAEPGFWARLHALLSRKTKVA